ncbi:hypothetical protein [Lacunimicrobium album]
MSDAQNQNAQSHYSMEEQFAADMAPASAGKPAKTFLMFSLIAFGAVGGYVNANWESYKDVLSFASVSPESEEKSCCSLKRLPPPGEVFASMAPESDACPISGKASSCCSHKDELAAATGGEAPCCSQMNKAIVAAMMEVATKSDAVEDKKETAEAAPEAVVAPASTSSAEEI